MVVLVRKQPGPKVKTKLLVEFYLDDVLLEEPAQSPAVGLT